MAAAAVVMAVALVNATVGSAAAGFKFDRYAGQDRYDTAAKIATDTFGTSDVVIIASGEVYPDALAASYIAGIGGVPLLLTQKNSLPTPTSSELTTLHATKALIVGGTAAVSDAVNQALIAKGIQTNRISGNSRYETSQKLAESAGATAVGRTGTSSNPTAIVVSGENFPDALSAGPAAFAGRFPVILTTSQSLSPEAKTALSDLGIKAALVIGGTSAVSNTTEQSIKDLGITTTRLAGNDRTETATKVADWELANLSFAKTTVDLANGANFPDALAGSTHGGKTKSPLLLTVDPNTVGTPTKTWLAGHADTLTGGKIDGGTSAVSDAAASDATNAATTPGSSTTSTTNLLSTLLPSSSTTSGGNTTTTLPPGAPCAPGQQGPGAPFCFGTADTPGNPTLKSASATTTPSSSITLTYSEAVTCSTVDSNGSDYTVTLNGNTVAVTASCTGSSSTTVTLTPPTLKAGDSGSVTTKAGTDSDTVKDVVGNPAAAGETANYTVPQPGPRMSTVTATNGSHNMVVTYDQTLDCVTSPPSAGNWTIHVASGPGTTGGPFDVTPTSATCTGSSITLTLGTGSFQSGQAGTVSAVAGAVKNQQQQASPSDSHGFTVT